MELPPLEDLLAELDSEEPEVVAGKVALREQEVTKGRASFSGVDARSTGVGHQCTIGKVPTRSPASQALWSRMPSAESKLKAPLVVESDSSTQDPGIEDEKSDSSAPEQALSVKGLKAKLTKLGADFTGLVEKHELVALLKKTEASAGRFVSKAPADEIQHAAATKSHCVATTVDKPKKWEDDVAEQINEKLAEGGTLPTHVIQEMQRHIIETIANSEVNSSPEIKEGLASGAMRVRLTSNAQQLVMGELGFGIEPVMAMLPENAPPPEEMMGMFRADHAWRRAPPKPLLPNGARQGEQGVPLPACVMSTSMPDSAVPKGRRLIHVEFFSCTS